MRFHDKFQISGHRLPRSTTASNFTGCMGDQSGLKTPSLVLQPKRAAVKSPWADGQNRVVEMILFRYRRTYATGQGPGESPAGPVDKLCCFLRRRKADSRSEQFFKGRCGQPNRLCEYSMIANDMQRSRAQWYRKVHDCMMIACDRINITDLQQITLRNALWVDPSQPVLTSRWHIIQFCAQGHLVGGFKTHFALF